MIGLRESGLTYGAIAAQTGLSQTGVFNICRRFADHGLAGLQSGPRGPARSRELDGFWMRRRRRRSAL